MEEINFESPEMIFVEGGTFQMGIRKRTKNKKPVNGVTLSDFLIAKYQVTQDLWGSVTGYDPSYYSGFYGLPVERISWYDAVEFCNELSEKEGLQKVYRIDKRRKDPHNHCVEDDLKWRVSCDFKANGYRLPTEAEWEYAARGGNLSRGYKFSGSNHAYEVAWFNQDEYSREGPTHPVGELAPNELGIYDMSGNVWEWCWDWFGDYGSDSQTNPTGPVSGEYRVCRGGSWQDSVLPETTERENNYYTSDLRISRLGLRLVRSI